MLFSFFFCLPRRLKTVNPSKPLVVGSYAYLDGELHVRLSLAMDAIVKGLTESRSDVMVRTNSTFSFLPFFFFVTIDS